MESHSSQPLDEHGSTGPALSRKVIGIGVGLTIGLVVIAAIPGTTHLFTAEARGDDAPAAVGAAPTKKTGVHHSRTKAEDPSGKPKVAESAALAPTLGPSSPAPPQPPAAPSTDVAARLAQGGAGTCAAQVDALAAGTMAGVAQFNTVSNWASAGGDKRGVSVTIGQKYPAGSAVPYGATSVMAAPNGQGSCDAMAVQVVPSPLPCAKLRDSLATKGKQIGDLAGVPLMEDVGGQTLLVPTAANTCVLVGLHTAYAK